MDKFNTKLNELYNQYNLIEADNNLQTGNVLSDFFGKINKAVFSPKQTVADLTKKQDYIVKLNGDIDKLKLQKFTDSKGTNFTYISASTGATSQSKEASKRVMVVDYIEKYLAELKKNPTAIPTTIALDPLIATHEEIAILQKNKLDIVAIKAQYDKLNKIIANDRNLNQEKVFIKSPPTAATFNVSATLNELNNKAFIAFMVNKFFSNTLKRTPPQFSLLGDYVTSNEINTNDYLASRLSIKQIADHFSKLAGGMVKFTPQTAAASIANKLIDKAVGSIGAGAKQVGQELATLNKQSVVRM